MLVNIIKSNRFYSSTKVSFIPIESNDSASILKRTNKHANSIILHPIALLLTFLFTMVVTSVLIVKQLESCAHILSALKNIFHFAVFNENPVNEDSIKNNDEDIKKIINQIKEVVDDQIKKTQSKMEHWSHLSELIDQCVTSDLNPHDCINILEPHIMLFLFEFYHGKFEHFQQLEIFNDKYVFDKFKDTFINKPIENLELLYPFMFNENSLEEIVQTLELKEQYINKDIDDFKLGSKKLTEFFNKHMKHKIELLKKYEHNDFKKNIKQVGAKKNIPMHQHILDYALKNEIQDKQIYKRINNAKNYYNNSEHFSYLLNNNALGYLVSNSKSKKFSCTDREFINLFNRSDRAFIRIIRSIGGYTVSMVDLVREIVLRKLYKNTNESFYYIGALFGNDPVFPTLCDETNFLIDNTRRVPIFTSKHKLSPINRLTIDYNNILFKKESDVNVNTSFNRNDVFVFLFNEILKKIIYIIISNVILLVLHNINNGYASIAISNINSIYVLRKLNNLDLMCHKTHDLSGITSMLESYIANEIINYKMYMFTGILLFMPLLTFGFNNDHVERSIVIWYLKVSYGLLMTLIVSALVLNSLPKEQKNANILLRFICGTMNFMVDFITKFDRYNMLFYTKTFFFILKSNDNNPLKAILSIFSYVIFNVFLVLLCYHLAKYKNVYQVIRKINENDQDQEFDLEPCKQNAFNLLSKLNFVILLIFLTNRIRKIAEYILESNLNNVVQCDICYEFLHQFIENRQQYRKFNTMIGELKQKHQDKNKISIEKYKLLQISIDIKDFSFSSKQNSQDSIINNLKLNITNGKSILSGKSGSGKTTIFNIITGAYNQYLKPGQVVFKLQDQYGNIHPIDVLNIEQNSLLKKILYFPQNTNLPGSLSIEQAIKWFCPQVSNDQILYAMEMARIFPEVKPTRKLMYLSGGQKKRVVIAALFLKLLTEDYDLVLLDEYYVGLDLSNRIYVNQILFNIENIKNQQIENVLNQNINFIYNNNRKQNFFDQYVPYHKQTNKTFNVIAISHLAPEEIDYYADYIIKLENKTTFYTKTKHFKTSQFDNLKQKNSTLLKYPSIIIDNNDSYIVNVD